MVKRMERRNRGMESIRDIEDDVGRALDLGAATYGTKYSIQSTNFT